MITRIEDGALRSAIAKEILDSLPDWFGIPESILGYVDGCSKTPLWADMREGRPVGFIALRESGPKAGEVYVMGVRREMHRQGVGRALFAALYAECVSRGYRFLQVKTVDAGCYEEYDRTRLFYESLGFTRLDVFPLLWDERNPCLQLVMVVTPE